MIIHATGTQPVSLGSLCLLQSQSETVPAKRNEPPNLQLQEQHSSSKGPSAQLLEETLQSSPVLTHHSKGLGWAGGPSFTDGEGLPPLAGN